MAISKTQPMRSAEIEAIDELNSLSGDVSQLQNTAGALSIAVDSINQEIGSGFNSSHTIKRAIDEINQEIGSGFDSSHTIERAIDGIVRDIGDMSYIPASSSLAGEIGKLTDFDWQFRIGETEEIELSNGDPYSGSEDFSEPFGPNNNCIVFVQVISDESLQQFDLTLTECSYSGFSYNVKATDNDSYTIRIGYVAVCTNYQGGN